MHSPKSAPYERRVEALAIPGGLPSVCWEKSPGRLRVHINDRRMSFTLMKVSHSLVVWTAASPCSGSRPGSLAGIWLRGYCISSATFPPTRRATPPRFSSGRFRHRSWTVFRAPRPGSWRPITPVCSSSMAGYFSISIGKQRNKRLKDSCRIAAIPSLINARAEQFAD